MQIIEYHREYYYYYYYFIRALLFSALFGIANWENAFAATNTVEQRLKETKSARAQQYIQFTWNGFSCWTWTASKLLNPVTNWIQFLYKWRDRRQKRPGKSLIITMTTPNAFFRRRRWLFFFLMQWCVYDYWIGAVRGGFEWNKSKIN